MQEMGLLFCGIGGSRRFGGSREFDESLEEVIFVEVILGVTVEAGKEGFQEA